MLRRGNREPGTDERAGARAEGQKRDEQGKVAGGGGGHEHTAKAAGWLKMNEDTPRAEDEGDSATHVTHHCAASRGRLRTELRTEH